MATLVESWSGLCQHLAHPAMLLVLGATCLLGCGTLAVLGTRSPVKRQRLADLTVCATLVWLLLALCPLPRPAANWWTAFVSRNPQPPVANAVHDNAAGAGIFTTPPTAAAAPTFAAPVASSTDVAGAAEAGAGEVPPGRAAAPASPAELQEMLALLKADQRAPSPPWSNLVSVSEVAPPRPVIWPVLVWLAGTVVAIGWLLVGRLLLLRITRQPLPIPQWFDQLWQSLPWPGSSVRAQVVLSARIRRAMTWGLFRATIGLPAAICRPQRADQLRHIMLHEMGHVLRNDAWSLLLFNVAMPVLYFHPLFWYLRSQSRMAAELLADDWAAGHSSPEKYVEQLIAFVKTGKQDHALTFAGLHFFETPTRFYRRMQMLLERSDRLATRCAWPWRCAAMLTTVLVTGLAVSSVGVPSATAQNDDSELFDISLPDELDQEPEDQAELKKIRKKLEASSTGKDPAATDHELQKMRAALDGLLRQAKELSAQIEKLEGERDRLPNSKEQMKKERLAKEQAAKSAAEKLHQAELDKVAQQNALAEKEKHAAAVKEKMAAMQAAEEAAALQAQAVAEKMKKLLGAQEQEVKALRAERDAMQAKLKEHESRWAADRDWKNSPADSGKQPAHDGQQGDKKDSSAREEFLARVKVQEAAPDPVDSLDVLELATALIDAQAELEQVKLEMARISNLTDQRAIDNSALADTEIRFRKAQRKFDLLLSLTQMSLDSARDELNFVAKQYESGHISASEARRAKYRLGMLEKILADVKGAEAGGLKKKPGPADGAQTKEASPDQIAVDVDSEPGVIRVVDKDSKKLLWKSLIDAKGKAQIQGFNVDSRSVTVHDDQGHWWTFRLQNGELLGSSGPSSAEQPTSTPPANTPSVEDPPNDAAGEAPSIEPGAVP